MGTPQKHTNFCSPYSQNVRQYPSQTSDYMTQHAGGQQPPFKPQDRGGHQGSSQNTPHFYQNKAPRQENCGFYEDRQSSNTNMPHFYRNNTSHRQQGRPGRGFGHRGGRRGGFQHQQHQHRQQSDEDVSAQYFHSSMLEDPWKELMERHNAIHGSVIDEQSNTEFDT